MESLNVEKKTFFTWYNEAHIYPSDLRKNISEEKTASEMHVAPQIFSMAVLSYLHFPLSISFSVLSVFKRKLPF